MKNNTTFSWVDLTVSAEEHFEAVGTYCLTNKKTGEFYIGACCDFYNAMHTHAYTLRSGIHYSVGLQKAFDQSPDFHVEWVPVLGETSPEVARARAEEVKQQWLDKAAGNPKLLNVAPNRRPAGIWRGRPVRIVDRVYPNIEAVAAYIGIRCPTVKAWIGSDKFPLWQWAEGAK